MLCAKSIDLHSVACSECAAAHRHHAEFETTSWAEDASTPPAGQLPACCQRLCMVSCCMRQRQTLACKTLVAMTEVAISGGGVHEPRLQAYACGHKGTLRALCWTTLAHRALTTLSKCSFERCKAPYLGRQWACPPSDVALEPSLCPAEAPQQEARPGLLRLPAVNSLPLGAGLHHWEGRLQHPRCAPARCPAVHGPGQDCAWPQVLPHASCHRPASPAEAVSTGGSASARHQNDGPAAGQAAAGPRGCRPDPGAPSAPAPSAEVLVRPAPEDAGCQAAVYPQQKLFICRRTSLCMTGQHRLPRCAEMRDLVQHTNCCSLQQLLPIEARAVFPVHQHMCASSCMGTSLQDPLGGRLHQARWASKASQESPLPADAGCPQSPGIGAGPAPHGAHGPGHELQQDVQQVKGLHARTAGHTLMLQGRSQAADRGSMHLKQSSQHLSLPSNARPTCTPPNGGDGPTTSDSSTHSQQDHCPDAPAPCEQCPAPAAGAAWGSCPACWA